MLYVNTECQTGRNSYLFLSLKALSDDTFFAQDCFRLDQTWFQLSRVRATIMSLVNREESGPIVWKNCVVWKGSHTTRFLHTIPPDSISQFMSCSFQIQALFILTLILRRCKITKFIHSSFSIVIDVILTAQWKGIVIATSRLLLFAYCCTSIFFLSVPTHTRRSSLWYHSHKSPYNNNLLCILVFYLSLFCEIWWFIDQTLLLSILPLLHLIK